MSEPGQEAVTADAERGALKGTTYELFILAISLLSIINAREPV